MSTPTTVISPYQPPVATATVPEKRWAEAAGPVWENAPAETGLDYETLAVVAATLSRIIGKSTDLSGGTTQRLQRGLRLYAHVELARTTMKHPAAAPDIEEWAPCSTGETARKLLGLLQSDINKMWDAAQEAYGADAMLAYELLKAFVAPELWRVLAAMLHDGPAIATDKIVQLLKSETRRTHKTVAGGRGVVEGHLSTRTIEALSKPMRQVQNAFVQLRVSEHSQATGDLLGKWFALPQLEVPEGFSAPGDGDEDSDTTAPPARLVRTTWGSLSAEVSERLGGCAVKDEREALARLSPKNLEDAGLFRAMRNRAIFATLVCVGPRREEIPRLTVGLFAVRHALVDGGVGSTLVTDPRKGRTALTTKPIPPGLALVISNYLRYLKLRLGREQAPGAPLFISTLSRPDMPLTGKSVTQLVRGMLKRPGGGCYTPHNLRGTCAQLITSRAGAAWCAERDIGHHPICIAEAVLNHEDMKLDALGYFGAKKPQDRQRLSGWGTHIAWAMMATDVGARWVRDEKTFKEQLAVRQDYEAAIARYKEKKRALFHGAEKKTLTQVLGILLKQNEFDDLRDDFVEKLVAVREDLRDLKVNPARMVPLSDHVETVPVIDLEAIELAAYDGVPALKRAQLRPVRPEPYSTLTELAKTLGVSPGVIKRQAVGQVPYGDPRRSIFKDPDHPAVDNSLGIKLRRFPTSGIRPEVFADPAVNQRYIEAQTKWPENWSRENAEAPIDLLTVKA